MKNKVEKCPVCGGEIFAHYTTKIDNLNPVVRDGNEPSFSPTLDHQVCLRCGTIVNTAVSHEDVEALKSITGQS